nr:MAG TPA: hypothetical protein [Caudoviricetes sp.]
MVYEIIKRNFDRGLWTAQMVRMCVKKGLIDEAQYEEIVHPKKDEISSLAKVGI